MKIPTIFLCHSSRDKPFVRDLASRLKNDGVNTWLDDVEVRIGESIHQKVSEGLKRSDFFAIVLSRSSVASRWVHDELSSASAIEKYSARRIFILPILIETCDVPPLLLDRRYANFRDDPQSAYQELLDSVRCHFESRFIVVEDSASDVAEPTPLQGSSTFIKSPAIPNLSPRHFEQLIARMLEEAGFAVKLMPLTRDGGYDIIARLASAEQKGKTTLYVVQCKRYQAALDAKHVLKMVAVKNEENADRALIVSTSLFTTDAQNAARQYHVDLVEYGQLQRWLFTQRFFHGYRPN